MRANTALGFIGRLSQIETKLTEAYPRRNLQGGRDFEGVARGRQEHAMPILAQFKEWLDRQKDDSGIFSKSPIRAAFTYTLNQWDALCRYTEEGYLSFDNNIAERLVKIPAIGRKKYLLGGISYARTNSERKLARLLGSAGTDVSDSPMSCYPFTSRCLRGIITGCECLRYQTRYTAQGGACERGYLQVLSTQRFTTVAE